MTLLKKIITPYLVVVICSLPTQSAHAFWGLLGGVGKAGSAAGKVGTVGKAAAVGVAAEEAAVLGKGASALTMGDDAARLGTKTSLADEAFLSKFSATNAALPPEVSVYLSKPAKSLTATDTADMMRMYELMSSKATKTGDFTFVDKLSTPANNAIKPANTTAHAAGEKGAQGISHLELHALRLLLHAAHAGNTEANREMNRICTGPHSAATFIKLCKTKKP